ncbi:DNA glycosylase AlkZ-like family protein [Staphylospora marina]|uniref:DNA glycosylase AlkZ-like family protein n=1 Tax=Staphylospora marina TaxID=2490858 RepID=UPI000F5BA345|nr:crosslink repair DNA glycosylase YcaQ family protein [Staphylospora marina]
MYRRFALPEISPSMAMHHVWAKHHVLPGFSATCCRFVAQRLFGLHAARLPTPYVTLRARIPGFREESLREELRQNRRLIKLRCMRRTLHILPLDLAAVAHRATLPFRLADCRRQLRKAAGEPEQADALRRWIKQAVRMAPRSSRELERQAPAVIGGTPERTVPLVRAVIREMWERGQLCLIDDADHWSRERRRYGWTADLYRSLRLNDMSREEAVKRLVSGYLERYGPVTEGDLAWWSGLGLTEIRTALRDLKDSWTEVQIKGSPRPHLMLKEDLCRMMDLRLPSEPWVTLLAYEDPTLKGTKESRFLYVDPVHFPRLFNAIGEARASIVESGRVIGVWEPDRKARKIRWETFGRTQKRVDSMIREEVRNMERFLFGGSS